MKANPLAKYQDKIARVAKANHVKYLALFGSYARGEQTKTSDVDFLVEFSKPIDLIDLIETEHKFEDVLGKKVDLITKNGLSKHLRPYVEPDLTPIYETA